MGSTNIQNADVTHYDMIVLGSGPAGQKAAIQAAKLRKKVGVVEMAGDLGGVCTNTGTIPSKSFREAVLYLSGFRERSIYGSAYRVKSRITMSDLTYRIGSIVRHEHDVIESQLRRNQIDIIRGKGSLLDAHRVVVEGEGSISIKTADYIVLAVGTRPHHPSGFEVDGVKVLDSDDILTLQTLPRNLTIVGGGIIGVEYASMFAVLGVHVTLVEQRKDILTFVDGEIVEALQYHMRNLGITLRLGEEVASVTTRSDGQVETKLRSGKKIVSESVLVSGQEQNRLQNMLASDEEELLFIEGLTLQPPRKLDSSKQKEEVLPFSFMVKTKFTEFPGINHISYQVTPVVTGPLNQLYADLHRLNPTALVPFQVSSFRLGFEHFHGKFLGKLFGSSPVIDWKFYFSVHPGEIFFFLSLPLNRDIESILENHWAMKALAELVENRGYPKLYHDIKPILLKALSAGQAKASFSR